VAWFALFVFNQNIVINHSKGSE